MKIDVVDINNKKSGTIELNSSLFGLEPRPDILNKVVRWQLAKRQQGTHSVLTRSEVSYSTKKIVRQKGSGSGRHGSRRAPIFRKGGVYKGPKPRSHAFSLTKKLRKLGLKHALSSKYASGNLIILNKAEIDNQKTSYEISEIDGVITFKNKNTTIGFIRFNNEGEVEYIFVNPAFRKQGLARKLLKLTKERLGKDLIPQKPISPLGKKLFNIT